MIRKLAKSSNAPALRTPVMLLLLLFTAFIAPAQKVFDFNANCQQAYKEIIQLRLTEGQRWLNAEKTANPNNLIPYFLETISTSLNCFSMKILPNTKNVSVTGYAS